ncbi:hypothetical protein DSECCO2_637050 [anaerobic digester metagenome]
MQVDETGQQKRAVGVDHFALAGEPLPNFCDEAVFYQEVGGLPPVGVDDDRIFNQCVHLTSLLVII